MQNQHKELWSLLHWANPERIKDWPGFNRHYVKALKMGQKEDATAEQLRKVLCGVHHGVVLQCVHSTDNACGCAGGRAVHTQLPAVHSRAHNLISFPSRLLRDLKAPITRGSWFSV